MAFEEIHDTRNDLHKTIEDAQFNISQAEDIISDNEKVIRRAKNELKARRGLNHIEDIQRVIQYENGRKNPDNRLWTEPPEVRENWLNSVDYYVIFKGERTSRAGGFPNNLIPEQAKCLYDMGLIVTNVQENCMFLTRIDRPRF